MTPIDTQNFSCPLLCLAVAWALAGGCGGSKSSPEKTGTGMADAGGADAGDRVDAQVTDIRDAGPTDLDASIEVPVDAFEPGQVPRRRLRAGLGEPTTWTVTAAARHTSLLDGDAQTDFAEVTYEVAVSFRGTPDRVEVLLNPTIGQFQTSYDTDLAATPPGVTRQLFDATGSLLSQQRFDGRVVSRPMLDAATLDVLTFPNAILEVPDAEVGVGASWGADLVDDGVSLRVRTEITKLTDTEVETLRTMTLLDGGDRLQSAEATVTATYDARSLVLRRAAIDLRSAFRGTVAINGVPQEVTATIEQTRSVQEQTP